jgi:hypothetical protein
MMMTTATDFLESSLNKLAAKLDELGADHSSELDRIRDALVQIAIRGLEVDDFTRNLKDLAEAVIHVRTKPGNTASLRELPVPPYDLWLPFKADDLADSDPHDLDDAVRIFKEFNHKVDASAFGSLNS